MIKNRLVKKSQFFKGATLAFAGMLALTMFPMDVFVSSAQYLGGKIGFETIEVHGAKSQANKGTTYEIKAAYFGSDAKIPLGLDDTYYSGIYLVNGNAELKTSANIKSITSEISVTYKPTGKVFKEGEAETTEEEEDEGVVKLNKTAKDEDIAKAIKENKDITWGTMQMDYAGDYGINYSITIEYNEGESKTFTTEYVVTSSVTSAYFEFDKNDETVLPTVYDISLAKERLEDRNVYLPIPKLTEKDGTEVDFTDSVVLGKDNTKIEDKDYYVQIDVTGGSDGSAVPVSEITEAGEGTSKTRYAIESKYLDNKDDNFKGVGNYTIKYSYYKIMNDDKDHPVFITSITKTFNVKDDYYKDGNKTSYEFSLKTDSTFITSAVTNVEQTLPTISATTTSDSSHPNEEVAIWYEIEAKRQTSTGYDEVRKITDNKFVPWEDGYYRIVYTAYDFYTKKEDVQNHKGVTWSKDINDVRDTEKPVAKVYDAANKENYKGEITDNNLSGAELIDSKDLKDASHLLKTKTGEKNIIIYAASATDNVPEGVVLSRTIRNSGTEITLDSTKEGEEGKNYAKYNLIFDFEANSFVANNAAVKNMMDAEHWEEGSSGGRTDETKLKEWLQKHNYLIVVSTKDADENSTVENGYAVIDVKFSGSLMLSGSVGGLTYSVYYNATDKAGNTNLQLSYDIVVLSEGFEDSAPPVISFPTQLKSSYRKGSVIVFDAPTASDDSDNRFDILTQYYYATKDQEYDKHTFTNGEYKIDLSEIDKLVTQDKGLPTKVVITVSTEDDYGKKGEWKKEISIIDVQDSQAPVLFTEVLNTPNDQDIMYDEDDEKTIVLPTLTVQDDHVDYMNSTVTVKRTDAEGKVTTIPVSGKTETRDIRKGYYTLQAGTVPSGYPGTYEATIVFTDAGDNQVTTFYKYVVKSSAGSNRLSVVGLPARLNEKDKPVEVGTAVELPVPSVDFTINPGYAVFGVSDDDSHTAYDYDILFSRKPESDYKFNDTEENTFTSLQPDQYLFTYKVRASVYNKEKYSVLMSGDIQQALVEKDSNKIAVREIVDESTNEQGGLFVYTNPATSETIEVEYGVYDKATDKLTMYKFSDSKFQKDMGTLYITHGDEKYYLNIGNTISFVTRDGKGSATFAKKDDSSFTFTFKTSKGESSTEDYTVTKEENKTIDGQDIMSYVIYNSDPVRLDTEDHTAPEILTEYDYPLTLEAGAKWSIQNVQAKDNSSDGINKKLSYIRVTHIDGDGTSFVDYKLSEHSDDFTYTFATDGRYVIAYYVQDYYNNINSDYSYEIRVGDCQEPDIIIPASLFNKKYEKGTSLNINLDLIDFSDNDPNSDRAYLLDKLNVKLTNTSTGEVLTNQGNDEEQLYTYTLATAGTYRIEFTVEDIAGWSKTEWREFEVSTDSEEGTEVYQTIGTVLIVVAVVVLVGVVSYFVISKVVRDKKAKGKAGAKTTKNKKK